MIIETTPCGPAATNAILVGCEETKQALLIDPAHGSFKIFKKSLKQHGLKPLAIYLTHSHWDHTADADECQNYFQIPIFVHKLDAENVSDPGSDGLPQRISIKPAKVDGYLEDAQNCKIGEVEFEIMHTPGHSPGGVVFYFPKENTLISGDTLFKGSIGNLSFPTAEPEKMWVSLKKLAKLPPSTKVFPGHGETTTIGEESWLDRAPQIFG